MKKSIKVFITVVLSLCFYQNSFGNDLEGKDLINYYKKIFKDYSVTKKHKVKDTISKDPINTDILEVFNSKNERVGFIRELITTTGCNSSCLPIIATLFYNSQKQFITVTSPDGLTKKNHMPFSVEDYQNLGFILMRNPKEFENVKNPKEMVDALTGETLKVFTPIVIREAAYTSLRLNTYNQDTLKLLKSL